jgi:hypothetical protein
LDGWSGGGWGVFIAPTTNSTVGEGCCRWAHRTVRCGTGHCPVRQPRHPTVRVLMVLTVGALTSWGTGQSGATPDIHCSLSGAPSGACSDSAQTIRTLFTLSADRWSRPLRWQPLLRWCTEQSGGTPDSLVNYSGARPQKPEGEEFEVDPPWCTGHCPVVHRTVRCTRPGFTSVSFAPFFRTLTLIFLLVYAEPLAPVECII